MQCQGKVEDYEIQDVFVSLGSRSFSLTSYLFSKKEFSVKCADLITCLTNSFNVEKQSFFVLYFAWVMKKGDISFIALPMIYQTVKLNIIICKAHIFIIFTQKNCLSIYFNNLKSF